MKENAWKSLVLVVSVMLIVTVMLVSAGAASTQALEKSGKSGKNSWSALDKVPRFLKEAEKAGFSTQEGKFTFLDLIKATCENPLFFSAFGNNPWPNAYFSLVMPNPPEADYDLPFGQTWQMEQDEAMVIIGQTPPEVRYFSIQTWVQTGPVVGVPDPANPVAGRKLIGTAFGDTTNNLTFHTIGPDPFNRPIVYIITGNQTTEQHMRAIARAAGYPAEIINVEALSTAIAPLGYGPSGSMLVALQRNAIPADPEGAWKDYVEASMVDIPNQPHTPYRAFRLSPQVAIPEKPYPAPKLRVRGTGQTEMDLYPALSGCARRSWTKNRNEYPPCRSRSWAGGSGRIS